MRNLRDIEKRLWKRANLFIGALSGEPGRGSFTGTLDRQMKEDSGNGTSLINFIK